MRATIFTDEWCHGAWRHSVRAVFASVVLCAGLFGASGSKAQDVDTPSPGLEVGVEEEEGGGEPGDITLELAYTGVLFPIVDRIRGQAFIAYNAGFDILLGVGDLSFDVHENVDVGITYIVLARLDGDDEHTLRAYQSIAFKNGGFKFDVRNAIDYRLPTGSIDDRTRFRSRIRSTYNGDVSGIRFSIYVSAEPIYNFNQDEFTQISFAVGGYVHLVSNLWLNAFYQRTETKVGPDVDFPGAGILGIF
ncbi:MAG: DUF2490 domain-containing protein [Myxococcota bacterium]